MAHILFFCFFFLFFCWWKIFYFSINFYSPLHLHGCLLHVGLTQSLHGFGYESVDGWSIDPRLWGPGVGCKMHACMLCLLHVGHTQSFMFVFRFFALYWKWVFLDIICEGPTIQSLIALKFCPMGLTIEDSWLEEIWFLKQKFWRCMFSCISSDSNQGAWILAKFGSTPNDSRI